MSISSPFIRRPVATSLLMAAILLAGIAAYPLLPVAPLPRVEFPTIRVTANLPGASPETMASTVAQPLKRQFSQISGVAQMTSVSVGGSTQVVVQFDLDRNIDGVALDVQAAIITVPLALVGTFAVMHLSGYSLNNLTLMALTIAAGFVVDDAIVMLENIYRHIEDGMAPEKAALQGAGEIGFTIISISLPLIAVFIPLLLMGGIVGRLFREFAMTVAIAVMVSAFVSLTLTPMMCSRFLKHHSGQHGLMYRVIERFFVALLDGYRRTLDIALRFQFVTLMVFFGTPACTAYLYMIIPKSFFPTQDTGVLVGLTEAGQDVSFAEISRRQMAAVAVISADPAVAAVSSSIGAGLAG